VRRHQPRDPRWEELSLLVRSGAFLNQLGCPIRAMLAVDLKPFAVQLVVFDKEPFDVLHRVWTQLPQGLYALVSSRMTRHSDESVISLPAFTGLLLPGFDDADKSATQHAAAENRRIHKHQNIQWIPVAAQRGWNEPEIEGKRHAFRQRRREFKTVAIGHVAVFIAAAFGCLHDGPQITAFLIVSCGVGKDRVTCGLCHGVEHF
jgi:hypothetical protein